MRIPSLVLAAALLLPAPPATAQTADAPELQEWEVPYASSRPRDQGPDSSLAA